ncbi:hypothetical protein MGU_07004 [Metarhizium guizhouense ARSEF 977]|uniref:Fungal transcriptional regulatory protein n=1 Tax=Metarhizium guizhouense (strain ARSEF 977) TaxID=1276136 RepID=A0A0B4GFR9_METGA|nr:hypothetical protein MGU_07004 [Metarhizium guizhouense ARSEF 977]
MSELSTTRPRAQSPPRRQRACVPCSKAKARCHFQDSNIERHVCDSRVSNLEKQIETLTAALEGQNQGTSATSPTHDLGLANSKPSPAVLTPESPAAQAGEHEGAMNHPCLSQHQRPPRQAASAGASPSPIYGLTWPQSDRILSLFRDKYIQTFPFLVLDERMSARQMYAEKPFLFRVIMLAAAPLPIPRMVKIKRNVLAYLGQHMLVEEERQLDLLQGLLVCISWADLRTLFDEQITNLTYLALGYAHNLGITKIPPSLLQQIGMDDAPEDLRQTKRDLIPTKMHSIEEQRTFLGCYCLLSVNSTLFGRQNPLRSQYVDLCCESLKRAREHPSDMFLEHNVRLVQMGEKISEAFGAANDRERGKPYLFLLDDQSRGFREELDALMQSLDRQQLLDRAAYAHRVPAGEFDDWERFFTLHYNYLLVRLYEPATFLHEIPEEGGAPSTYRAQCLRNCLFASKAYFDVLFTLPPSQYVYQSITFTEQITFVLVITTRLLLLETSDWDVHFARVTVDFLSVVDRLVQRLEASEAERVRAVGRFVAEMGVDATPGEVAAEGRVADIARKMRWIRTWFEKRADKDGVGASQAPQEWPVEELENRGARAFGMGANGPVWFTGLLSNSAWNFDDLELG